MSSNAGTKPSCLGCNSYEDRLEEIRMALACDRTKQNPYLRGTIEYSIWEMRQTIDDLRKQNRHDRKQWKHELHVQKKLRKSKPKTEGAEG